MTLDDLPEAVVDGALAHARLEYPRESCGLVVRPRRPGAAMQYLPRRNAAVGEGDFRMDPSDMADALDRFDVLAVAHSHPNGRARPSEADRVMMARWGLPWLIVGWPTGERALFEPPVGRHVPPLEGREFSHGVLDCYALVRDYYHLKLALELPDYPREDDWWLRGQDLYLELFPDAGFVEAPDGAPREHDVLLMQVGGAPTANHAGVFLGDSRFMHHLDKRLSRVDLWTEAWRRRTVRVVRHRDLC